MKSEYILSFKSTHDAFKTQNELATHEISFMVFPTPVEISANCGISLYIQIDSIEIVKTILKDISDVMYVKAQKNGSHIVPIELKD